MDVTPSDRIKRELSRRRYSSRTIDTYIGCVERFLFSCKKPVNKITKKDVREYIEKLSRKERAGNTLNVNLMALKFYFEQCLGRKMWIDIKYSKVPKKIQRCLRKEEVRRLLGAIDNWKHRLMIELMYSSGMRVSEVTNVKIKDFNFEGNYGFVRNGKGGKDRIFVLSKVVKDKIMNLIDLEDLSKESYVFVSNRGGKYNFRSLQQIVKNAAKRDGLKDWKEIHCHTLRHSFATHLIEQGDSVSDVQAMLGHKSPETSLGYLHSSGKMLRVKSPFDDN
jgi:integrase/recombinase XerD